MAGSRGFLGKLTAPKVNFSDEIEKWLVIAFEKNNIIKEFHSSKIQKITYEDAIRQHADNAKISGSLTELNSYITYLDLEILKYKIQDLRILAEGYIVSLANLEMDPEKQKKIIEKYKTELVKIPVNEFTPNTKLLLRRFITSLSLLVIEEADKMIVQQDVEENTIKHTIPEEKNTTESNEKMSEHELNCLKYGSLAGISENRRTESICLDALSKNREDFKYIPDNLFTAAVCSSALKFHGIDLPPDYAGFLETLNMEDRKFIIHLVCNNVFNPFFPYEKIILTCTELASRKQAAYLPNEFNPTILNGVEEFKEYLNILKQAPLPCRERFIIRKGHSHAGDIQITADGKVSVLFADSYARDRGEEMTSFAEAFPEATIYTPAESRQTDSSSCHEFAISDLMLFYTVEKRLEKTFAESGLHGYLEDSKKLAEQTEGSLTTHCLLPLPFLRTAQHYRSLVQEIKQRSNEEKALPVNKKLEHLTIENAITLFKRNYKNELTNTRFKKLEEKRNTYIINYILRTRDIQVIKDSMTKLTLQGFRSRIQQYVQQHTAANGRGFVK